MSNRSSNIFLYITYTILLVFTTFFVFLKFTPVSDTNGGLKEFPQPILLSVNYQFIVKPEDFTEKNTPELILEPEKVPEIDGNKLLRDIFDLRSSVCKQIQYDISKYPPVSVIFPTFNEDPTYLLKSVYSVLYRTPPQLLNEIIIVDDGSTEPQFLPDGIIDRMIKDLPRVKKIKLPVRKGIVAARLAGIKESISEVFVILDCHIEVTYGWLEPLVKRIAESPRTMVMPVIDSINMKTMKPEAGGIGCRLGFIWKLMEHGIQRSEWTYAERRKSDDQYVNSPTMAGGLFAANRKFFYDLGAYDTGMSYWGAENIELSFRLWQCGGSLECSECSHIHHRFGSLKSYPTEFDSTTINRLRTAAIWMDQYAHLTWTFLGSPRVDYGDIEPMKQLRDKLKCHNFKWYLKNVYPESKVINLPQDVPFLGTIKFAGKCLAYDLKLTESCDTKFIYFARTKNIHSASDEECLLPDYKDVLWKTCDDSRIQRWTLSESSKDPGTVQIKHDESGLCLTADEASNKIKIEDCEVSNNWLWEKYNIPENFVIPKN